MIRPRKQSKKKGQGPWIITYSDLMTLILVFFILLFASSQLDVVKFRAIADSFQERAILEFYPSSVPLIHPEESAEESDIDVERTLDIYERFPTANDIEDPNDQEDDDLDRDPSGQELDELLRQINAYLEEHHLAGVITATREEQGIVLVLQERILFPSGEANMLPEAKPFLDHVSSLLETIPNIVKVEGHTDDVPISNLQFPSNWELSAARASRVIRYFSEENELESERFIAIGHGEYRPVDTNETAEGRQNNRRVLIIITDPTFDPTDQY